MVCVSLALLDRVDDGLGRRLEDSPKVRDFLIGKSGVDFLLAVTEDDARFTGVEPLRLRITPRTPENIIALLADEPVDFSIPLYRAYADPFNTRGLISDPDIGDGFIFKTKEGVFHTPEDGLSLLRRLQGGAGVESVLRREGEYAAAADGRLMMARYGRKHPLVEDILRPFPGGNGLHVLSFSVDDGGITVDNTFKPEDLDLAFSGV
jgi:fructose 1,6-bisphosphatase